MSTIRNFDEARQVLHSFYDMPGSNTYTLERMRALMDYLGNPQDTLNIIHVAGTSGKTSTCYYAAALLRASGATVGLTVSPHVDEVNERVQINLTPLPEAEFCQQLGEFTDIVHASGIKPSYFEFVVAFAFWEFARKQVDYAVVEVGLGGLLDGTNIIRNPDKVCVITDIGLDHTNVLGKTLHSIATQKAGIIQSHNHVFMYPQGEEVIRAVRAACKQHHATLHEILPSKDLAVSDLPLFQQRNLGLAEQAIRYVLERDAKPVLTDAQLAQAARVYIPARMEVRQLPGGKVLIIDGSHNAQKLEALTASIRAKYPNQSVAALVAFVNGQDERWQSGVDVLLSLAHHITATAFSSEQDVPKHAIDPTLVANYCRKHGFNAVDVMPDPAQALAELLDRPERLLLIAGSFYLLNHIRPLLANKASV